MDTIELLGSCGNIYDIILIVLIQSFVSFC